MSVHQQNLGFEFQWLLCNHEYKQHIFVSKGKTRTGTEKKTKYAEITAQTQIIPSLHSPMHSKISDEIIIDYFIYVGNKKLSFLSFANVYHQKTESQTYS